MKKIEKETFGIGIIAAFIASLCCLGPLILIFLGLGTASTALSIGAQKPYFLIFGLLFFVVSLFLFIKYRRKNICQDCTTKKQEQKKIISIILLASVVLIIFYILLIYVITPWLAPVVYTDINLNQKNQEKVVQINDLRHTTLTIDGMWCSSCAVSAEYALKEKDGVVNATVGFNENLEGIGEVIYNPKLINLEEIIKTVEPYKANMTKDKQATSIYLPSLK